jgi:hypothetical protein
MMSLSGDTMRRLRVRIPSRERSKKENVMIDGSKEFYEHEARRYDVSYNGMQDIYDGSKLPLFTHPLYGTFAVWKEETLPQAILRKQEQFSRKAAKENV